MRRYGGCTPGARGGSTSADNGLGLCEQCNYLKESHGWRVTTDDEAGRHGAVFSTPTGGHHHSAAPPVLPGRRKFDYSEIEQRVRVRLYDLDAA